MTILDGPAVRVIDDLIESHSQGWQRTVTVQTLSQKVRAVIYRDFYSKQSRIYVEVWSPEHLDWNRIHTLSGIEHGHLPSSATSMNLDGRAAIRAATESLVSTMICYAREVLS